MSRHGCAISFFSIFSAWVVWVLGFGFSDVNWRSPRVLGNGVPGILGVCFGAVFCFGLSVL